MSVLAINHNLMAANTANNLQGHYSRLATSTQRLSSGLRINSAADDAAGLAIRELMRSDIAALHQGARNINDAISMLQTMDGALGVIDEKLIRMKELAEQAATGTYDSTQRLMIDSEFQAMGSEIDRIANATDFNGVKLLCTKMKTWFEDEQRFVITDPGSISNLALPAGKNGTPTPQGIDANRYVNAANPAKTISVSLTATAGTRTSTGALDVISVAGTQTEYRLKDENYTVAYIDALGTAANPIVNYNANTWSVTDDNHTGNPPGTGYLPPTIAGTQLIASATNPNASIFFTMNDKNGNAVDLGNLGTTNPEIAEINIDTKTNTYRIVRNVVEINATTSDYTASYNDANQTVTVRLANGGTVSMRLDNALAAGDTINFDINFEGETKMVPVEHHGVDPSQKVKIHFGTMNDSAEDYYYINYKNCTREGLGISDVSIQTQDDAQNALISVRDAIVAKDKIRAEFGAMQNRLENTLTNVTVQAENLQAAESRLSDADIATEMTKFVRNQILTQSSVAMLGQANSMPQLLSRLLG